jgi:hypothetical protein
MSCLATPTFDSFCAPLADRERAFVERCQKRVAWALFVAWLLCVVAALLGSRGCEELVKESICIFSQCVLGEGVRRLGHFLVFAYLGRSPRAISVTVGLGLQGHKSVGMLLAFVVTSVVLFIFFVPGSISLTEIVVGLVCMPIFFEVVRVYFAAPCDSLPSGFGQLYADQTMGLATQFIQPHLGRRNAVTMLNKFAAMDATLLTAELFAFYCSLRDLVARHPLLSRSVHVVSVNVERVGLGVQLDANSLRKLAALTELAPAPVEELKDI